METRVKPQNIKNTYNINNNALNHIFNGEIDGVSIAGFHHEDNISSDKNAYAKKKSVHSIRINKGSKIYEALVYNKFTKKIKKGNNGLSTFFPEFYTRQEIVSIINRSHPCIKIVDCKGISVQVKTKSINNFFYDSSKDIFFIKYFKGNETNQNLKTAFPIVTIRGLNK